MKTVPTVTEATSDDTTITYAEQVPWIVTVRGIGKHTWDGMSYSQHIVMANSYNGASNRAVTAALVSLPSHHRDTTTVVACEMFDDSYELPADDGKYYTVSIAAEPSKDGAPPNTTFLTLEVAKQLTRGTILAKRNDMDSRGMPRKYKVTSVKTWKTRPDEVAVMLQYGVKVFGSILEYQLSDWYILGSDYHHVPR